MAHLVDHSDRSLDELRLEEMGQPASLSRLPYCNAQTYIRLIGRQCKHGVLALWIFLSIGATGPATGLLQLCKHTVGGPFDSSSGQTWSNFSESPLTRQTCAGTHLVGTSDGGALDWPCE